MITIEHRWVGTGAIGTTVCTNCHATCNTHAVDQGGPFFAADGSPLGMKCPPCPLVPEPRHRPGPWSRDAASIPWILDADGASIAKVFKPHCADLIAQAPAMRDALEATLIFHATSNWSGEVVDRWEELTGTREATTRVLCDTIRKALR